MIDRMDRISELMRRHVSGLVLQGGCLRRCALGRAVPPKNHD